MGWTSIFQHQLTLQHDSTGAASWCELNEWSCSSPHRSSSPQREVSWRVQPRDIIEITIVASVQFSRWCQNDITHLLGSFPMLHLLIQSLLMIHSGLGEAHDARSELIVARLSNLLRCCTLNTLPPHPQKWTFLFLLCLPFGRCHLPKKQQLTSFTLIKGTYTSITVFSFESDIIHLIWTHMHMEYFMHVSKSNKKPTQVKKHYHDFVMSSHAHIMPDMLSSFLHYISYVCYAYVFFSLAC